MTPARPLKKIMSASTLAAALIAPLVVSINVQAGNRLIKESRDWGLWESTTNGQTTCYLQSNTDDYYLLIMKSKNTPSSAVDLQVQMPRNRQEVTGMIASIAGVSTQLAFSDANGRKTNFWGIPKNLSGFMAQMRAGRESVQIRGVGGKRDQQVAIPTRGFDDVLKEMEKRCNANVSLTNSEFETRFLAALSDTINPLVLDVTKTGQARSIYNAAYADILEIQKTQADLNVVLQRYKPLTDEYNQNRSTATRIQNTDLPNSQRTLADAQRQQVDSRAEITRIDAQIPGMTTKIQTSQRAYDAARATLAPHEPEYNRITGNLSAAQSNLSQAQSRLSRIDQRLRDGASEISSLEYELNNLERNLPQKERYMQRAYDIYRDAHSALSNFNVTWEKEQRLRRYPQYGSLVRQLDSANRDVQATERDLQQSRRQLAQAEQALNQCLRPNSLPLNDLTPAPGDGGGGRLRPGPGDGPRPPRPPRPPGPGPGPGPDEPPVVDPVTPPEPRDCSSFQTARDQAQSDVEVKRQAHRQSERQRDDIARQVYDIEERVNSEVSREYDALARRESEARRDYERHQDDVTRDQNRASSIRTSELPTLEREQQQLSSERPSVLSNISSAQSSIAAINQELTRFKSSTGWDRKAAAVESTGQQLRTDQAALATAQSQKSAAQTRIQQAAATENQMKTQISSLNSQLATLNARAVVLERGLATLPAERAPFDTKLSTLGSALTAKQTQLLALVR